jgi:autophagy-related protein 13
LLLHRSSSSSSRQLSSVPPMVHGTSVSTSSSPGKPISPHTPHTPHYPAVPSRLSDNLTIDYSESARRSRSRRRSPAEATREENSSEGTAQEGTTAIDIPTSPRAWPFGRRSSSASGQLRERDLGEEPGLYGRQSASLPNEERADLSTSELLRVNIGEAGGNAPLSPSAEDDRSPGAGTASEFPAYPFPALETSRPASREDSSLSRPGSVAETSAPGPASRHQSRFTRRYGRASPSFSSDRSRYSGTGGTGSRGEDDEMIFQLSELGNASRRSLEDTAGQRERGGGSANGSSRGDRRGGWNQ